MTDMVPTNNAIEGVVDDMARLNITWAGDNGDMPDLVPFTASDDELKRMAAEAVQSGYIPGIAADEGVDLSDFVVDRFAATEHTSNSIFIRPKTPFGR